MIRRMLIASSLLIAGALYLAWASNSEAVPIRRSLSEIPAKIGAWAEQRSTEFDEETLKVLGVDDYANKTYSGAGGSVLGLYIGYYASQRQGDTMHSPLNCLPGAGWNPIRKGTVNLAVSPRSELTHANNLQHREIKINRIIIQKGLDRQVVLYWYQSHGRVIASEYWGKIYTVYDALRINRTDAALVRVIIPINGMDLSSENQAEADAMDFVGNLFPLLDSYLPAG